MCQKGQKCASDPTPNQDNFFILQRDGVQVYGVFDGHGPFGHLVSFRLVQSVPSLLVASKHYGVNWKSALAEAFILAQAELLKFSREQDINVEASGASGTVVVVHNLHIHTAHIGDSGALLACWNKSASRVVSGTQDHKPEIPAERQRLETAGSEVRQVDEDTYRIYKPGTGFPGLTMSRAFGDTSCKGVLQVPDYSVYEMQSAEELYIIIASDGVWEFLSYSTLAEYTAKKLRLKGPFEVARFVVQSSRSQWNSAYGGDDYCDDITTLVVQLNAKVKDSETNFAVSYLDSA